MLEMKLLSFIKHKVRDKIAKEKLNLNIFQLSDNYSITATITPSACQMLQIKIDSSTRKYIRRTQKEFNTSELAAGLATIQNASSEELFALSICHRERSGLHPKKWQQK
jgi:hypothetical protein